MKYKVSYTLRDTKSKSNALKCDIIEAKDELSAKSLMLLQHYKNKYLKVTNIIIEEVKDGS